MSKLYSLVAVIVLMTGCSYKNEAIELSSYKTQYIGQTTQDMSTASLSSVTDIREDKTSIGYVEANGQVTTKLYSYVNFADRYRDGLARVLKVAKFNLVNNPTDANTKIDVKIKDIQLIYNDTNKFDENLKGKIIVELTLTKADKVNVLTFTQKQGIWIKPSYTSKDVEPLLDALFTDSINDIVSKLANK
ncbi:MAG: hypothetical protein Q8N01_07245 [Sulfuricurvum sp.]|nr:hypothetical protein [Sulfuricurvum sp.]MDP3021816.1 hypothetical protein [Sulfuricurvum sp.]MDP3120192.1 hypothetical protein [Sulfuricurvum sp.]